MNRNIGKSLIRGLMLVLLVLAVGSCTLSVTGTPYYTVTYNANSGSAGSVPFDSNYYQQGATVTVLGQSTIVRTGYVFSGWNMSANGSGAAYTQGQTFAIAGADITLYAEWTASPSYVRISNVSSVYTISHVWITPHSSSVWGNDLLSPGVLTPGYYMDFQVTSGTYDAWITDTTSHDALAYSIAVAPGATAILYYDGFVLTP